MKRMLVMGLVFAFSSSLLSCSDGSYTSEEAIERGDIVVRGKASNLERFEEFLQRKRDAIRITNYTLEGDPIFSDLRWKDEVIHYSRDNSYDQFAGDEKGKTTDVCKAVTNKKKEYGEVEYYVSECETGQEWYLFRLPREK